MGVRLFLPAGYSKYQGKDTKRGECDQQIVDTKIWMRWNSPTPKVLIVPSNPHIIVRRLTANPLKKRTNQLS